MKELDKKRFIELLEHATERKNFVELLSYYSATLSIPIVLYVHCYLYDKHKIDFHHWGDEIIDYNNKFATEKLKGNDTYSKRKKAIVSTLLHKEHEMKSEEYIGWVIETINEKEEQMIVILTDDLMYYYTKMLDTIIENIASHKMIPSKNYNHLNSIFK
jgi:hypothetical protein